ncbi:MAG TPA: hypothetical protein VFD84_04710 [Candidatus Binatia bacterium]|jgi:hypothetical protein|nr:hypothetical protein [Candidatus Binatia bacterium]
MRKMVEGGSGAVVFVCDRQGAPLERRVRCLRLAGIRCAVETEHRASGTYYKVRVRDEDAVEAHLALQLGGCARSSRLRQRGSGVLASLGEIARTLWDEARHLVCRALDVLRATSPRLLAGR